MRLRSATVLPLLCGTFFWIGVADAQDVPLPPSSGFIEFKRDPEMTEARVERDSAGVIWCLAGTWRGRGDYEQKLLRWTGKGWEPAPPRTLPHPEWTRRSVPPWHTWQQRMTLQVGRNGSLLVVAVGDIHQQAPRDKTAADPTVQALLKVREKKYALYEQEHKKNPLPIRERQGTHWLVGWLYSGGKWVGPLEIDELVRERRETFLKDFTHARSGPDYVHLVSHDQRVWYLYGQHIKAFTADGVTTENLAAVKNVPDRGRGYGQLVRVPSGLWLHVPRVEGGTVYSLSVRDGKIETREQPEASKGAPRYFALSKNQGVFGWGAPKEKNYTQVVFWREGRWEPWEDGRLFCREDSDGTLWFTAWQRMGQPYGYHVYKDGKRMLFPLPKGVIPGPITQGDDGRWFAVAYDSPRRKYYVLELVPDKDGVCGRRISRLWESDVYGLNGHPVYVDRQETFIHEHGRIGRVVPKKAEP